MQQFPEIPANHNFADYIINELAQKVGLDRVILYHGQGKLNSAQLIELIEYYGDVLKALDVHPGDLIAISSQNNLEYVGFLLAALRMGVIPALINTLLLATEVEYLLTDLNPKLLLLDRSKEHEPYNDQHNIIYLDGIANKQGKSIFRSSSFKTSAATPGAIGDDTAFVLHTSGTTSNPKLVVYPHRVIWGGGMPIIESLLNLQEDDICLHPQELSHSILMGFLYPILAGAGVVLYENEFDVTYILHLIQSLHVTILILPLRYFEILVEQVINHGLSSALKSVKKCVIGGASTNTKVYDIASANFSFEIYNITGQTEAGIYIGGKHQSYYSSDIIGTPLSGRFVDLRGSEQYSTGTKKLWEICIAANDPGLASGYWNNELLWNSKYEDGWFHTGDLAYKDSKGYYHFAGRVEEAIDIGDSFLFPEQIDKAVSAHPKVLEAGGVGVSDSLGRLTVFVYVVLADEQFASEELEIELKQYCENLIKMVLPIKILFTELLPKTTSGKIRRKILREWGKEQA